MKRYFRYYLILVMMTTVAYGQSTPIQISGDVWFEKTLDTVDGRVSQGLATDGVYWYFSAKDGLYKADANYNMLIAKDGSQNPIPDSLLAQDYHHIGDIAYYEGHIYAPIEDYSYEKPIIAIYDADSLNYTGYKAQVPQAHFPWIAVDYQTGYFYSSEFSDVNELFIYDPEQDFALIGTLSLDTTVDRIQGGAILDGFVYLSCDNGDYVYSVGITTGAVQAIIQVWSLPEMEGIEAYPLDSGLLHFVAEIGLSENMFYHYDKRLEYDIRMNMIASVETTMTFLGNLVPMAQLQNTGTNTGQNIVVTCTIDTAGIEIYRDLQVISDIAGSDELNISFAEWAPPSLKSYKFTFYCEMNNDLDTSNDTLHYTVTGINTIDDFDSDAAKWDLGANWELTLGRNYTWGVASTPRLYQNNMDVTLPCLQSFDLSGFNDTDSVIISVWTRYWLQENHDFCYLEASGDGNNWQQIGDYSGVQDEWMQNIHSLNNFFGSGNEDVQIRFHLISDSTETDKGIYIDDVAIYAYKKNITQVKENIANTLPATIHLFQNYPNPFNNETVIEYKTPDRFGSNHVVLEIYNTLGQSVRTLINENRQSGSNRFIWDGRSNAGKNVSSGIYFYQIRNRIISGTIELSSVKKMIYAK
ncbi:T9SS type A sorting domain-containing protein [candidate division KSB1 bacterium]|nr:T9SS type A sorting domain-containing protein [candidate division KSB1 bacterium]